MNNMLDRNLVEEIVRRIVQDAWGKRSCNSGSVSSENI